MRERNGHVVEAQDLSVENMPLTWTGLFLRRARSRPMFLVGLVALLLLVMMAIFAPWLAPRDPAAIDVPSALKPPCASYRLGTDRYGRDVLSRIIFGTRISLAIACGSIVISLSLGSALGMIAGYRQGFLGDLIMRSMDILFAIPQLILALLIVSILGPGAIGAGIAIAVIYTAGFTRIAGGSTLEVMSKDYVRAARAIGASQGRIILHHVLPNVLTPLVVLASLNTSMAILTEASLSYLGVGTQPPAASWGTMMSAGRTFLESAPWLTIFPGLAIMTAVLAFNLVGDGLRDILDPRSE